MNNSINLYLELNIFLNLVAAITFLYRFFYFCPQEIHILTHLLLYYSCVNLSSRKLGMPKKFRNRFQRYTIR